MEQKIKLPDMRKVMAVFSQTKEIPPFPDGVQEERIEIPYINKNGVIVKRPAIFLMPQNDGKPIPFVYMAHYSLIKESLEVIAYLNQGWAVASPADFDNLYNAQLSDDDLVFNSAALFYFSHRPEIDRERIAVTGGSAGGYTTLMLSALQLGICGSVARSALANLYFNMKQYGPYLLQFNESALMELREEDRLDYRKYVSKLPLPFANVLNLFKHEEPDEDHDTMVRRYSAISPVGIADALSAPCVEVHYTSDLLVPVDQITRKYTGKKPGDTLPADFKMKLTDYPLPGVLSQTLEEVLPEDKTEVRLLPIPRNEIDEFVYYSENRPFTIAIYDEGMPENYASHTKENIVLRDVPVLHYWFSKGRRNTNFLSERKAELLVERYAGMSPALPAHRGVDDTIYGSLAIYREEIIEGLRNYQMEHLTEDVPGILIRAVRNRPELQKDAKALVALLQADAGH